MMVLSTLERVVQLRHAGRVQRAHIIPHHGSYSDAEHQWGVAMLLFLLWPRDFARLGIVALTHDVAEGWLGDVPSNVMKLLGIDMRPKEHLIHIALGIPLHCADPPGSCED